MTSDAAETAAWRAAYAAPELAQRRRRTYETKLRRLELLPPKPGPMSGGVSGQTLDVACGHGDALRVLERHGYQRLVGVDIFSTSGDNLAFDRIVADGTRLPFAGKSFERILCLHSLHHFRSFDHISHLLTECRRVLRRDGQLYLLDHWGSFWLRGLFRILEWRCPLYPGAARRFGKQLREEHDAIFWWLSEWQGLYEALHRAGFVVERQSRTAAFLYLRCRANE